MGDEAIACQVVRIAASLKFLALPLPAWMCLLSLPNPNALPVLTKVTLRISKYEDYCHLAASAPVDKALLHTPILRRIVLEVPPCDDLQDLTAVPEIRTCQLLGPNGLSDVDVTLMLRSEVVPRR
ncbi:hypothetical protein EXIGLDRAFT_783247 [Exidia glandulosa HHB12029]|uniref:Uncharacterized protein n=1 Tax=Exidia glandulosa HHB12029 TaxID=1314781 RepID=A0A166N664_EXIGL|nr:hypothetical protein EXIGLDRAFT_783247 [Exidia glandulosa HHB12029]